MLEQRTQDLRTAENVAMQSIPMIKTMEFSNYNLVRKINSAFIVTLPVFKQALAQAILLKRQKIQAESIAELDKKTNEMLLKNAQNTVDVSKMTAKMASGSSIQIETLEDMGNHYKWNRRDKKNPGRCQKETPGGSGSSGGNQTGF